jgi:3-methyladenine DNA glycosylase AlkC
MHALTQLFTAEFCLRPFLIRYPGAVLERLTVWTRDTSPHVRRLVSEGTRTRLPWAPRLKRFQEDPAPVISLLERLKDDPEIYVRRSVANNLNDIGKDHPALVLATAQRWLIDAPPERRWIVRHALRSLVKGASSEALALLDYRSNDALRVEAARVTPKRVRERGSVTLSCRVVNEGTEASAVLVDLRVHFVKAGGRTGAKVFKLKAATLLPGSTLAIEKTLKFIPLTTRKHYPGLHRVELILNGRTAPWGAFTLMP